jgi:hypothetical protein
MHSRPQKINCLLHVPKDCISRAIKSLRNFSSTYHLEAALRGSGDVGWGGEVAFEREFRVKLKRCLLTRLHAAHQTLSHTNVTMLLANIARKKFQSNTNVNIALMCQGLPIAYLL